MLANDVIVLLQLHTQRNGRTVASLKFDKSERRCAVTMCHHLTFYNNTKTKRMQEEVATVFLLEEGLGAVCQEQAAVPA